MTDDVIRVEFETTLEELVDVYVRQVRRSKQHQRWRLRSLISGGAVAAALIVAFVDTQIGRPVGSDIVVAGVLGGFLGILCGPLYDRSLNHRVCAVLVDQYGTRMPMRCEIELRQACLWVRQDGVEVTLDWTTAKAVDDTVDGIDLWFDWGLVVTRNRAFATASDRDRFVNRARASFQAAQHTT